VRADDPAGLDGSQRAVAGLSRRAVHDADQARAEGLAAEPAQRLYLDAFDRLLRDRDDVAAALVDYYFGAMTRERSVPDRRRAASDVDAMLLGIARGVLRPIAADDLAA
jgi:hypothetical protein